MTHPQEAVEAVELHACQVRYGHQSLDFLSAFSRQMIALHAKTICDLVAPLYREQAARDAWRDMPPPNDEDILVLRSTGALQYIEADDNDYTWHGAECYADAGAGVDCPVAWMPAAAIRKR